MGVYPLQLAIGVNFCNAEAGLLVSRSKPLLLFHQQDRLSDVDRKLAAHLALSR